MVNRLPTASLSRRRGEGRRGGGGAGAPARGGRRGRGAQAGEGQTAVGDRVDLGQSDQRLGNAAQFLGLRQGGLDQLVLEQRGGHVLEHRFAVRAGAAELTARLLVTHGDIPWLMRRLCGSLSPSWRYCADCGWSWPPVLDDLPANLRFVVAWCVAL